MTRIGVVSVVLAVGLLAVAQPSVAQEIHCEGAYDGHLQGIAMDAEGNIYWSFTVTLVKTDGEGHVIKKVEVPAHHGDCWVAGERLYVAVNHGKFSDGPANRKSYICAYETSDLTLAWKKEVPEVRYGAGALTMRGGHFFVASGRVPKGAEDNRIFEYDGACQFIAEHILKSGPTYLGIQTMAYVDGTWWFGCYGEPRETLRADDDFTLQERLPFECSLGIAPPTRWRVSRRARQP